MKKFLVMVLAVMLICVGIISVSSAEPETYTIGKYTYYDDGDYSYELLPDGSLAISMLSSKAAFDTIPTENNGRTVTSIGGYAYTGRNDITSVTIPDTITSIGTDAFMKCQNLTEVILPDTMTFIDAYAFRGCSSLESITIPDSVTYIGEGAFISCEKLSDIRISPDHPIYEFSNGLLINKKDKVLMLCQNHNAESYKIPFGFKRIGSSAFEGMNLTSVIIPDSVTTIGRMSFSYMDNLKEITIPDGVTSIGAYCFSNTKNMTAIRISSSVTELGTDCFLKCSNLETIEIDPGNTVFEMLGNSLINKQKNSLYYHLNLDNGTFEVPEGITVIEKDAFEGNTKLECIIIPDTVEEIENCAFRNCANLTSIRLPDKLQIIDSSTFARCKSLKSLTIPEGVIEIQFHALDGCENLEEVVIPASVTSINNSAFTGCNKLVCKVVEGSYAQKFCEKNGIKFVIQ